MSDVNLPSFRPYRGPNPYIFASYAHKNSDAVFAELERLHKLGHRIWYDEGIYPGKEWPDEIANALDSAAFFLVFVSPDSAHSPNVRNEINFALNRNKAFLAVHLAETLLPGGLELRMGDRQAILKWRITSEEYKQKLQQSLPIELSWAYAEEQQILCSMSTIASEVPKMVFSGETGASDLTLHEDEWRQIEFFAGSRFDDVCEMMISHALFEEDHRHGQFWTQAFCRGFEDAPVLPGPDAVRQLAGELGREAEPGPLIYGRLTGRASQGFTIRLNGTVLYGQAGREGIMVLGAKIGLERDETGLTDAFRLLHKRHGLILIDWLGQALLASILPNGDIFVRRPTKATQPEPSRGKAG